MIGWNVDIGYSTHDGILTDISQIVFTDYNTQVSLPSSDITDWPEGISYLYEGDDPILAYEAAKSIIGGDVDAIWGVVIGDVDYNIISESASGLKFGFPSIFNNIPNFMNIAPDIPESFSGVVRFVGTNYIIVFGKNSPNVKTRIYTVNENLMELMSEVNWGESQPPFYMIDRFYQVFVPILTTSNRPIDFTNPNNFSPKILNFSYNTIEYRVTLQGSIGVNQAYQFLNNIPLAFDRKEDDDPYNPGGGAGSGGGGGDFDNTSTPVDIPSLPSISIASSGFISLYNPTYGQLRELSDYMWSDLFEIDGWKKIFANPIDVILGLSILPVNIPSTLTKEVKIGNIGTGIMLSLADKQFVEVDCGSLNINEYWGAYLDYEPYTQAQIFLPYIGIRPISVDDIMGKAIRIVYHVDILTGACCCFIKCGESVLYTYNGQCSIPVPITSANYTSVVNGVISIASSLGSLVATGGASAPTAVPEITTSVVNQMKPQIEKSGSISGSGGILNIQTPYLILTRPRQALPLKQNEFIGYPSLVTVQLTELSGYTEVQSIHLENIPATQEELAEIQSLLEGGVIF